MKVGEHPVLADQKTGAHRLGVPDPADPATGGEESAGPQIEIGKAGVAHHALETGADDHPLALGLGVGQPEPGLELGEIGVLGKLAKRRGDQIVEPSVARELADQIEDLVGERPGLHQLLEGAEVVVLEKHVEVAGAAKGAGQHLAQDLALRAVEPVVVQHEVWDQTSRSADRTGLVYNSSIS